jgi:hypothetical protein
LPGRPLNDFFARMRFTSLFVLSLVACAAGASSSSSMPAKTDDRSAIVSELESSRAAFLTQLAGLSPEQLRFKAAPDRWSIAETAEHIIVAETALDKRISEQIIGTDTPKDVLAKVRPIDDRIVAMVADRTNKRQASEALKPTGRFNTLADLEDGFNTVRAKTTDFVKTSPANFRAHAAEHPAVGALDGDQWFLFVSGHCRRHTAQIAEVKASPSFPR